MAIKFPAPISDAPACFGDRYLSRDTRCARCAFKPGCEKLTAAWAEKRSLSELLAEAEVTLDDVRDGESVEETYTRLHQEFFGRRPRHGASARHAKAFETVRNLPPEIDRETYIAGNMWAMQAFAKESPYGFQPMMLSGERAMRRYHAYLGQMRRRFRHGRHTAKTSHTERGRLRRELFETEHEIAEWFVSARVAGKQTTWSDAVSYVNPGAVWTAAHKGGPVDTYHRLCSVFGTQAVPREAVYATLRVACAIAEQYEHRLADRIGVRVFDWPAFADLVARILPSQNDDVVACDLVGVEGRTWPW